MGMRPVLMKYKIIELNKINILIHLHARISLSGAIILKLQTAAMHI
jgi:hypothetical protein